jgi:glyoxylase-like metal-dependent hydrolase (beta-lactamase superfamily II)
VTAGWQEVGDGCFRRRYRSFDLNIGVVRGGDGLLVLDTRADLPQAEELLDDLAAFGQPVRWVVNSHWHFDHLFGNQRFREAAGGSGRPADAEVAADLELWGHQALPPMLARSEADGFRADLRAAYGDEAGDEYDRVVLTPPDHLVVERHVLDLGDRGVELAHLGRGHTDNDLVVSVPGAGVVYAGDLLEESAPPAYGDDSYPLDWPGTADALVAGAPTTLVPGHGDVMGLAAAAEQAGAISGVADVIRALHEAGVPAADALAEGGDRWPFPPAALRQAVLRAYTALG